MLSHFTLKTHWTALAPIKRLFFTGVAIIKPDLPIIFLNSLPLPSPCCGPSQGGRDKDGPGMGNGASKLNITSVSLETSLIHKPDLFLFPLPVSFSPLLSFSFFIHALMTCLSMDMSFRFLTVCFYVSWVDTLCLLSQPSISPFSFFRL